MCRFWATKFDCGCFTWRKSGYEFCEKRSGNGNGKGKREGKGCVHVLEEHLWHTFCPNSRKAAVRMCSNNGGKLKCNDKTRLPRCSSGLDDDQLGRLCAKCNSEAAGDDAQSWSGWCPGHQPERLTSIGVDLDPQAEFEKAVEFWPIDLKQRYFRRKKDKTAKGCGWSL
ncbi:hypothetical protein F4810DRAFT_37691 [Camillea tinctor]|nr:hypothetical protein F4810DRAFT_37691 [Camillea tinctor]